MAKMRISDIKWDRSGDPEDTSEVNLPSEIDLEIPTDITGDEEVEEYISDRITEITGFCHDGFSFEEAGQDPSIGEPS